MQKELENIIADLQAKNLRLQKLEWEVQELIKYVTKSKQAAEMLDAFITTFKESWNA